MSEIEIARLFLTSQEYTLLHATSALFLEGLYGDVLGRTSDSVGLAFWGQISPAVEMRSATALEFLKSRENSRQIVVDDYLTLLQRAVDAQGLEDWLTQLVNAQLSLKQVALAFLASQEFLSRAIASPTS